MLVQTLELCPDKLCQGKMSVQIILPVPNADQKEWLRWLEHDPEEIYGTVLRCIEGALATAQKNIPKVQVVAVGITNQRETTVVWDRLTGKPLHNAIAWPDGRTAGICRRFAKDLGGAVRDMKLFLQFVSCWTSILTRESSSSGLNACIHQERRRLLGTQMIVPESCACH